ncbi:MAG: SMC-Scp complex subunit ScpB, partial [Pseudomonadota bacterium]
YAAAIRTAADVGDQVLDLREYDVAVLAAIAYHQPITRDGLKDIFGKDISRDLIGRLHARGLIGTGPRSPRRGAPYTYVTTEQFLVAFDLESLQDLPDREQMEDAGVGVT